VNSAAGKLRIVNVSRSDEGNYACVVNTTGHPVVVSGNAHLYVESMISLVFQSWWYLVYKCVWSLVHFTFDALILTSVRHLLRPTPKVFLEIWKNLIMHDQARLFLASLLTFLYKGYFMYIFHSPENSKTHRKTKTCVSCIGHW